jgi:Putative DNA-binding domain
MPTPSRRTEYQWHPSIHEAWAKERLHFWRLAFSPTYDSERIVAGIRSALAIQGATAFTLYELFAGGFDVFIRVWLPTNPGALESDLHEALGQYALVSQAFSVDRIMLHWPWEARPGSTSIREVPAKALRRPLPRDEIQRINRRSLPKVRREEYEALNYIAPLKRRTGVKFFTVISAPSQGLTRYAMQKFEGRILEVVRRARGIAEKSMYAGHGFGQYLLVGRAVDYFAIERELTTPLNDSADPAVYGARTTTFPVSRPDFLASAYELHLDGEGQASHNAIEALEADESQTVEVKGSVFVDIRRWLSGDGKLETNDALVDEGFLKAVTGLLNADGGTLVIGAVERARYETSEPVVGCPRIGEYIVLGIENDRDGTAWDRYARKLRQLIDTRLKPDCGVHVAIGREHIGDRTVAVVTVRSGDRWYYHYPAQDQRGRFWVRQGNQTVELEGPAGDDYRTTKPR